MRLGLFVLVMASAVAFLLGGPKLAIADPVVVPDSGLFRTVVQLQSEHDLSRAESTGASVILREDGTGGMVVTFLADGDQLEGLARLGFLPVSVDDVGAVASGMLRTRSAYASTLSGGIYSAKSTDELRSGFSAETQTAHAAASSLDDDADGLTNTQESWWCTNPLAADSDSDSVSDGNEVAALKRWLQNTDVRPSTGKPFLGWPSGAIAPCIDADYDSIPDLAERWDLGLNANSESTDNDRYDDGQELFGVTNCPGGAGSCGYGGGTLPHVQDGSLVSSSMPTFVKAPGNHPLAAAFALPAIDVLPSSLRVQPVTTITSGTTTALSTERTYSTARTDGVSNSVADTLSWNSWQESSTSIESLASEPQMTAQISPQSIGSGLEAAFSAFRRIDGLVGISSIPYCISGVTILAVGVQLNDAVSSAVCKTELRQKCASEHPPEICPELFNTYPTGGESTATDASFQSVSDIDDAEVVVGNSRDVNSRVMGGGGSRVSGAGSSGAVTHALTQLTHVMSLPKVTETNTTGSSRGGAQTTTHTTYEEHTVTNGENILTGTEWEAATAIDSSRAGQLWFNYRVRNGGNDFARAISQLQFNIFIGEGQASSIAYIPGMDLGPSATLTNVMPGEEHQYTSRRLDLTLEQLKAIDLGEPIRIVVEDFAFANDELFYLNAVNAGVTVAIEDGTDDGDESIDRFIMPIIAPTGTPETVYAILARFFPNTIDANGQLTAIWTPEYRADTPSWCDQPKVVGLGSARVLWCRHALSTADWWNIYTNGLGTGSEPLEDTPASPGSIALFRFNSDSDLDGYSDRSEAQFGTNPNDASSHPGPNLVAGVHNTPALPTNNTLATNTVVTSTLSLLNLGVYDAYGVEAVMISPDSTTTILNNTVGGSGRVKAQKQVIVGSRVALPATLPGQWGNTGHARPVAGGYFTGTTNRTYTFTTSCAGTCTVGLGSWTLNWNNGAGSSGSLQMGSTYKSPTLLDTAEGVKVALISGTVSNNETFTITATTPADTFQFRVNSSPFTPPLVIVSYNDPQGNHRFVVPASARRLSTPSDNLASLGVPVSQMLPDPGVEIVTTAAATLPGANASNTKLLVNNPTGTTLTNAKLFLNFINQDGTVVREETATVATLLPGPTYVPMSWNTSSFSPAFNAAQDYIVLAFLTDYDGNIIDTGGRPLSSWQVDPVATAAATAASWNFGTAVPGVLLQHTFPVGSTGQQELVTYLNVAGATGTTCGLGVSGTPNATLAPGDVTNYNVTIDTSACPIGAYSATIPVRTSDPAQPTINLTISGTLVTSNLIASVNGAALHPLDYSATITGPKNAGEWVEFAHGIGLDPATLEPVKVYDSTYSNLLGVGEAATNFGTGASSSAEMFGAGEDGDLVVAAGQTRYAQGSIYNAVPLSETAPAGQNWVRVAYTSRETFAFQVGDEVIVHQTQATTGSGNYEFAFITSIAGDVLTLNRPLTSTFTYSGTCMTYPGPCYRAQVDVVPHFRNVTVQAGGTLTCRGWALFHEFIIGVFNDAAGGLCPMRVSGEFYVAPGGKLDLTHAAVAPAGHQHPAVGFRRAQAFGFGETRTGESYDHGVVPTGYEVCQPQLSGEGGSARGIERAGGGAGHGTTGQNGGGPGQNNNANCGGLGGATYGGPNLLSQVDGGMGINLGSGGGASSGEEGGGGGGALLLFAASVKVEGQILADGQSRVALLESWENPNDPMSSGGGGSGGSVLITARNAILGVGLVTAKGGAGGALPVSGPQNYVGGTGGDGRIMVRYCDSASGTTSPIALSQKLNCYIAEQKDGTPATTRLNLPAAIPAATTANYKVQYGRKATFASAGNVDTTLPIPAGIWDGATIDALISGTTAGAKTLTIDIGNDGAPNNVVVPFTGGAPVSLEDIDVKAALNAYYQANGGGGTANVPVRVTLSGAGTVLLTNLELIPTASTESKFRIQAGSYGNATLTLGVGTSGTGPLDISVDVGDNGSIDWTGSGTYTYPATITTGNIATQTGGLNTYLTGKTGEVDVPVRITATPSLARKVTGYSATPNPLPELDLGTVTFGTPNPVEGATINVSVPVTNTGTASGGTSVTFFGISPTFGRIYIGSSFLASVGGSTSASIPWNTLGFTGLTSVEAVIDYYGDVPESNENNNSSTGAITIATRPDLKVEAAVATNPAVTLSIPEPVTSESVSISINVKNGGQASAPASTAKLYNGDPASGGVLIGSVAVGALSAGSTSQVSIPWTTPTAPGLFQLVVRVDDGTPQTVTESDEGNNSLVVPVYVGVRGPLPINSGAGIAADPAYDAVRGWGFVDGGDTDIPLTCATGDDLSIRYDPTAAPPGSTSDGVKYRFDNLQPGHFYHLDLVMHECTAIAGRVQAVEVNGVDIATGEDLTDGQPHKLSLLLDPASYAGRTIDIRVHETSGLGAGAIVNSIALHDIDYRYADSGATTATDPNYASSSGAKRYGYVSGGSTVATWGILPSQTGRQNSLANVISYRFDGLSASKSYKVNGTFYHGTTQTRTLQFQVDGVSQQPTIPVPNSTKVLQSITVPLASYSSDGSIEVTIVRTDTSALPVISEISLEEVTLGAAVVVPPPCRTLTTGVNPALSGTVTRNTQPSCEGNTKYPDGTPVQLTATPATDYIFDSWSGGLGNISPMTVTLTSDQSITANFARCYSLSTTAGSGGSVQVQTTANCPNGKYKSGTQVTVVATANSGFSFGSWSGDSVSTQGTIQLSMTADRAVTASFTNVVTCFTLTASAGAGGSVVKAPATPDCPTNGAKYQSSTVVELTATANPGYVFTGWTGTTSPPTNPLQVTMSSDKTYTANFAQCRTLAIAAVNGTVAPNPAPNCDGGTKYTPSTSVQLTATPSSNYAFDQWSGDLTGGVNPTTISMTANRSVTANFVQCYSLATPEVAGGLVAVQTASNCAGGKFKAGTSVSLLAVANNGFFFQQWGGDANGALNPTNVVMSGNRSVTAQFSTVVPCYSLSLSSGPGGTANASEGPDCAAKYASGTDLSLQATPDSGFVFKDWTGTTTETANPLDLTMNGDKSYTANFVRCYAITTTVSPGSSGTVGKTPGNCPGDSTRYIQGTTVSLTPNPSAGWSFLNWSGSSASGDANPLLVIANADKSMTANFVAAGDGTDHPVEMTSAAFVFDFNAANATKDPSDPIIVSGPGCAFSEPLEHSIWMRFTATQHGTIWVSTAGSGYDTVVAAFAGSPSAVNQVGCNDDGPSGEASFLVFQVTPGTTYWVEFGSWLTGEVATLEVQADWFGSSDVNCSHTTNAVDALLLIRFLAGLSTPDGNCPADADRDNSLDVGDALYIRMWIAGLLPGSGSSFDSLQETEPQGTSEAALESGNFWSRFQTSSWLRDLAERLRE